MKKIFLLSGSLVMLFYGLSAQKYEPVTVKAGMKVADCFPYSERYRYSDFTPGRILMKSGAYSDTRLNYDFLTAEVVFIRNRDTLALVNPKDLKLVTIGQDTFYYDKGFYLESLTGGPNRIGLKQYIKLRETLKQDSYGSSGAGSAITSYGSLPSQGNFYKLVANEDLVFQRTLEYYLSDVYGSFEPFTRKNVLQLFPVNEDKIKAYLKTNKVKFDNPEDLIKLAGFLRSL